MQHSVTEEAKPLYASANKRYTCTRPFTFLTTGMYIVL